MKSLSFLTHSLSETEQLLLSELIANIQERRGLPPSIEFPSSFSIYFEETVKQHSGGATPTLPFLKKD